MTRTPLTEQKMSENIKKPEAGHLKHTDRHSVTAKYQTFDGTERNVITLLLSRKVTSSLMHMQHTRSCYHTHTKHFMHLVQGQVLDLTRLLHLSSIVPLCPGSSTSIAHSSVAKAPSQINNIWKSIICNMLLPKRRLSYMQTQQCNADIIFFMSVPGMIDFHWFSKRTMCRRNMQNITN